MSKKFSEISKQLNSTDTFTFGKYYMCTVEDVLNSDPSYIAFLVTNYNIPFSEYIREEAMRRSIPKIRSYVYDGALRGEQAHYSMNDDPVYLEGFDDVPL